VGQEIVAEEQHLLERKQREAIESRHRDRDRQVRRICLAAGCRTG
jgi:hypothetical protein